jgi:hypothetical protein
MCCSNTTRAEITVNCWGFSALRADHQAGAQRARQRETASQPGLSICPRLIGSTPMLLIFLMDRIGWDLSLGLHILTFFQTGHSPMRLRTALTFLALSCYRNEQRVRDFHPSQGSYLTAAEVFKNTLDTARVREALGDHGGRMARPE